jgi:hypothetical protein
VKVDPNRKVVVTVESRLKGETVATVVACHGGKPRENIGADAWKFTRIGDRRDRTFNADVKMFGKTFQVDEVRIKVDKGLCQVKVEQLDKSAKDQYLFGGKSIWGQGKEQGVTITITGDYQAGPTSTGTLVVSMAAGKKTEEFTLENGKSKTFAYDADQGVKRFTVKVGLGKGGVKVRTQ